MTVVGNGEERVTATVALRLTRQMGELVISVDHVGLDITVAQPLTARELAAIYRFSAVAFGAAETSQREEL